MLVEEPVWLFVVLELVPVSVLEVLRVLVAVLVLVPGSVLVKVVVVLVLVPVSEVEVVGLEVMVEV